MPKSTVFEKISINGVEWCLDGDILLRPAQVDAYREETAVPEAGGADELTAFFVSGKVVRWSGDVVLRYAVLRATFDTAERYGAVVAAIEEACLDWEGACGVKFEHVTTSDLSANAASEVTFVVKQVDMSGKLLAAAFFPSSTKDERVVIIDPTFFGDHGFDQVGILRHELGHVLGFRHEHIRNAAAAALLGVESTNDTYDLTQYDSKSVMHYVGGGFGNSKLAINELDKLGAQRVYGLPLKLTTTIK